MSKSNGLGAAFYMDGVDLSGDIGALSRLNSPRGYTEQTGIDKSAMERLHSHRNGGIEFSSFFNKAAGQEFLNLTPPFTTSRIATYVHRTSSAFQPAFSLLCKQTDRATSRGNDASLTMANTAESTDYGTEWGRTLTIGKRTDTAATNGTGVDFAAATAFGLQAWVHVFSFTGTSVTIKLQESSDNAVGDAYADVTGGGFTVVSTAPQAQRLQTTRALAVERWLRVVTTGTFSECTFAVAVKKNTISTVF